MLYYRLVHKLSIICRTNAQYITSHRGSIVANFQFIKMLHCDISDFFLMCIPYISIFNFGHLQLMGYIKSKYIYIKVYLLFHTIFEWLLNFSAYTVQPIAQIFQYFQA